MNAEALQAALGSGRGRAALARLYGRRPGAVERQTGRWGSLLGRFAAVFPGEDGVRLFSSPGRTEIGGNHTDHNAGRVLAAAVDLDIAAAAAATDEPVVVIESEGYPRQAIELEDLSARESERFTPAALTRGVCARLVELGWKAGGFRACLSSQVLKGSGLSSSAAYEVLVATILNRLYNEGRVPPLELAVLCRFAENVYYGKPCGLMDQTACAVGGLLTIDFADLTHPAVEKLDVDWASLDYSLVIVDTGGHHAELNAEYAAIEREMKQVAAALGGGSPAADRQGVLRTFSREQVLREAASLRRKVGDRALLRALHFFDDDRRVGEQAAALRGGNFPEFLRLVRESGESSWMLLQNCYPPGAAQEQGIPLALAISRSVLKNRGACRVHGGGFAGTIQAFVPEQLVPEYLAALRPLFGHDSCHELQVRPEGAAELEGLC